MMKARSLFTLTTLLLLAAATAYAVNPEGSPDDHHLCYKAKATSPKFVAVDSVSVADEFETTTAKVAKSAFTCNPADFGLVPTILDANTHLAAYKIKSASKHTPRSNLLIADALGQVRVDTKKADLLLVPGAIAQGSNPTPPAFLSHNVDNYKCYTVKVSRGSSFSAQEVALKDEYSGTTKYFQIKKPKHLCLPVSLNGSTIKNSGGYLMCYQAKAGRGQPKHIAEEDIRIGNVFNQLETLSTKKEEEVCFPSAVSPICGDNLVNQLTEECDGTSAIACLNGCSENCGCWRPHTLTLDSAQSRVEIRGVNPALLQIGIDHAFALSGLAGTITINTGNRINSGLYEVSVPTATLPPVDIVIPGIDDPLGTACIFLQEDPTRPGSGLAGTGVVSCFGGPGTASLPSPNFYSHQDHCSQGLGGCDSGTAFASQCTPEWAAGETNLGPGKIHAGTGACVPATPTDSLCTATDPRSGSSAKLENGVFPEVHGACNSPSYSKLGQAPYNPGDTVIVLNASVELRSPGDPCTSPPTSASINASGPITTGTATSTIMDAFPGLPGTGKVQALVLAGSPLTCIADELLLQHVDPIASASGASFVVAVSALDLSIAPFPPADLNAGLVLKAQ